MLSDVNSSKKQVPTLLCTYLTKPFFNVYVEVRKLLTCITTDLLPTIYWAFNELPTLCNLIPSRLAGKSNSRRIIDGQVGNPAR